MGFDLENWICRPNTWSRSNLFFTLFNWGPPSPVSSGSGPRLMENICTWKQHSIVGMMFVLTALYQVLLLQAVQRKQKLLIIWCVVANAKLSILNFQVNHSFRRFGLVCSKLWMGVEPANPYMYTIIYMIHHKIQKLHSKKNGSSSSSPSSSSSSPSSSFPWTFWHQVGMAKKPWSRIPFSHQNSWDFLRPRITSLGWLRSCDRSKSVGAAWVPDPVMPLCQANAKEYVTNIFKNKKRAMQLSLRCSDI